MATNTTALIRQIRSAGDLKSVVRTMKASAASAIGQYEKSTAALPDCARTLEPGLGVCLRSVDPDGAHTQTACRKAEDTAVHAVVFGSDQGWVGRFNEVVVDPAVEHLGALALQPRGWSVGERVHGRLRDAGLKPVGAFAVPASAQLITRLVGQILLQVPVQDLASPGDSPGGTLRLFYNRPTGVGCAPASQRPLPLDDRWQRGPARQPVGHHAARRSPHRRAADRIGRAVPPYAPERH